MDIAKSLFLGGEFIHADNPYLNYLSYKELGLRCGFCGEPVYFRNGHVKIPHFAHFPDISYRELENCILKQTSYSILESWLTSKGKEQRLKIFQEYFLDIIAGIDSKFYEKIQVIQNRKNLEPDIEKIIKICATLIVDNKKICFEFIDKYFRGIENEDYLLLKEKIIQESLDYLCVASSKFLLEQIIQYLIHQYEYNSEIKDGGYLKLGDIYQLNINQLNKKYLYLNRSFQVICVGLLFILIKTNWLEKIEPIRNLIKKDRIKEPLSNLEKQQKTKNKSHKLDVKPEVKIKNIFYYLNLQINKPYELYRTESKYDSSELNPSCFLLEFKNNFQFQLIIRTGSKEKRRYLGCLKNIYKGSSINCIYVKWNLFSDAFNSYTGLIRKDITDKIKHFFETRVRNDSEKIIIKPPMIISYQEFICQKENFLKLSLHRKPGSLTSCPYCSCSIRVDNLKRHINKKCPRILGDIEK